MLLAISILAFVLTLPTAQSQHRGSCMSEGQRKVLVRGAAFADSVARELLELRQAIRSATGRRPSPSVAYVERNLLASQKLLVATGLNLRSQVESARCRPPGHRRARQHISRSSRQQGGAGLEAALRSVAGAAGSPAYDLLTLASAVLRAVR
jgi:hypothetical protein